MAEVIQFLVNRPGILCHIVLQDQLERGRGNFCDERRVIDRFEGLFLLRIQRVHRMAPLMRERRQRRIIIVVVQQDVRVHVVGERLHVGTRTFALLRINVHPTLVHRRFLHLHPVVAQDRHRFERDLLAGLDVEGLVERYERRVNIVIVHLLDAEHACPQAEIPMQGR